MVMEKTVPATPIVEDATAPKKCARTRAPAVVEPGAVDQPSRKYSAAINID